MSVYYQDDTITLHQGDSLEVLRTLPAGSVDCCVTSPPYFGLRDYGHPDQIGAEPSPAEYVERLRELFAEVRRVLADDGTLWLNLGDAYATTPRGSQGARSTLNQSAHYDGSIDRRATGVTKEYQVPQKNLLGIPWMVAFALQDDGWILRNAICWTKPNAMPESVTDRLSTFAGSGTTGEAAIREGFTTILIEREADYLPLILERFRRPINYIFDFEGDAS